MNNLTPQRIVQELDRYIVGQEEAKRAVAVALRNRERRRELRPEIRNEVMPKNILMIGPTGVGKTEIARRLAAMINAPFLKVEATKFTEVGYVGRDVESIIHDLMEASMGKVYQEKLIEVENKAERLATERILNYLCQQLVQRGKHHAAKVQQTSASGSNIGAEKAEARRPYSKIRHQVAKLLGKNQLEDQYIEIEVGSDEEELGSLAEFPLGIDVDNVSASFSPFAEGFRSFAQRRKRKVQVKEARRILTREEANKLLDFDQVIEQAQERAEENAIIFIDELDKLVGPKVTTGRDVSGEGVQRDLLPLLEGTTVMSRYGSIKTHHMLFVAAGTFYHDKPADLIPELQGRFPLRVELNPLSPKDLERILTEPRNALTKQYQALLATEGLTLTFAEDGIREIARLATLMNERMENIGARRLHTIMERVLEELSFTAAERRGEQVVVDAAYVSQHTKDLVQDENLSRYIL